jgi:hypothetical protein
MLSLKKMSDILSFVENLFGKDYNEFSEIDPFNPQNKVEGFISRKSNQFYGALIITKINDDVVEPQLIMATPKIDYPFGVNQNGKRDYNFPIADNVEIYEKLDGSNCLAYIYKDSKSNQYLSFKLRLRPFLANSRFGNFLDMWKELVNENYDEIQDLVNINQCNLSFEIYGNRNTHLVIYPNTLDYALLFGVNNEGKIFSPIQLESGNLPIVRLHNRITKSTDYSIEYEALQKSIDSKLVKVDEYYKGMEGTVWYLHTLDGKCLQFKCKPEQIELIHFASSSGLSKNVIIATCFNAFENVDKLSLEFVNQLLLEEFESDKVEKNKELILNCIEYVTNEMEFRKKVIDDYQLIGININLDKRTVMRTMSTKYPKDKIGKVYSIIANL